MVAGAFVLDVHAEVFLIAASARVPSFVETPPPSAQDQVLFGETAPLALATVAFAPVAFAPVAFATVAAPVAIATVAIALAKATPSLREGLYIAAAPVALMFALSAAQVTHAAAKSVVPLEQLAEITDLRMALLTPLLAMLGNNTLLNFTNSLGVLLNLL